METLGHGNIHGFGISFLLRILTPLFPLSCRRCVAAQLAFPRSTTASFHYPVMTSSSRGRWSESEGKACLSQRTHRSVATSSWSFPSASPTGSPLSQERSSDSISLSHKETHQPQTHDRLRGPNQEKQPLLHLKLFDMILISPSTPSLHALC